MRHKYSYSYIETYSFFSQMCCMLLFYVPLSSLKITNYLETTRSFIFGVKLFDSHCEASINMHNTLLLCYSIMHGRETLMCSLDKEALNLEKPPVESVKKWFILMMSSLVEEEEHVY